MFQIAIDGPSGAGKSTVAKSLAKSLGIVYVDTGALYRAVGYYVKCRSADPKNAAEVTALLPEISVTIRYEGGTQHVLLNGEDLGDRIRKPEISMYASAVSAIPAVRTFLLDTQRNIAKENSVVMDGRDIGTVILPNADVKIFLSASPEARARRRYEELKEKGIRTSVEEVLSDMAARDKADKERKVAPAVAAPDAICVDNSDMDAEQTRACIEKIVREKVPGLTV